MKLTNQEVKILTFGLRGLLYDNEGNQKQLPLLPSVRIKRMISDLEDFQESIREIEKQKEDKVGELSEDLNERVDDDEDDLSEEEANEEFSEFLESIEDELEEVYEQEVNVDFSDPLTEKDINRLDDSGENFASVSASAVDIILTKIVD